MVVVRSFIFGWLAWLNTVRYVFARPDPNVGLEWGYFVPRRASIPTLFVFQTPLRLLVCSAGGIAKALDALYDCIYNNR